MHHTKDPSHDEISARFKKILHPDAYQLLTTGWCQAFRQVMIQLTSAVAIVDEQQAEQPMDRPTKELYTMAGLIFLMEFRDWSQEKAVDSYMFRFDILYALNLYPGGQDLC